MARPEVLVFVMQGCGSCADLKPLVDQLAAHYAACVDTRVVDVDQESPLADAMSVEATPTALAINPARHPVARMVGHDGTPARIIAIYQAAVATAQSCAVKPFTDV